MTSPATKSIESSKHLKTDSAAIRSFPFKSQCLPLLSCRPIWVDQGHLGESWQRWWAKGLPTSWLLSPFLPYCALWSCLFGIYACPTPWASPNRRVSPRALKLYFYFRNMRFYLRCFNGAHNIALPLHKRQILSIVNTVRGWAAAPPGCAGMRGQFVCGIAQEAGHRWFASVPPE